MGKILSNLRLIVLLILTISINKIVVSQCNLDLGPDTVYCGYPFVLDAGPGYESYEWQNGSTNQTFTVSATGTYQINTETTGANVVTNGDFEQGNVGFVCGYIYNSISLWNAGTYWVGPNANTVHPNFVGMDHTPPPGVNFLIVNGSSTAGITTWGQSVTVTPNTDYKFSAWVSSLVASSPAQLQFKINGVTVGPVFFAPPATNTWIQYFQIWNSGANTTADISIINQNIAGSGNDFGIDDISFMPIIICSDTIEVFPSDLSTSLITTDVNCNGEPTGAIDQTVSNGYQPYTFEWSNFNQTEDLSNIIAGVYTITVTDAANCEVTETVTISEPPSAVWGSLVTTPVNCFGGNDGSVDLTSGGGSGPYSYLWNNGQNSEDIFNLISATYTVTITDINGCESVETEIVGSPDLLSVILQGNSLSCYGDTDAFASPIVSGGVLDFTYAWSTGANTQGITNLSAGTYSVTVTDNNGCTDTASISFEEPAPISLYSSGDQTICLSQTANIVTNSFGGTLPYTYYWNPGGYGTPNIDVTPYTTTEYCVYISDANNCLSNQRCITIEVNPPLELDLYVDHDSICLGDTITLSSLVTGGGGPPYTLEVFQGPVIDQSQIIVPAASGKIIVIAYDNCGSPSVMDTIYVNVSDAPIVSFSSNKIEGCEPLPVVFNINYTEENWTYYWSFEDGPFFDFAVAETPLHIFQNPGEFDVKLNISNGQGCSREVTVPNMITVHKKPESIFESDYQTVSIADPVINYYNFSIDATNSFWIFGDGDSLWIEQPPEHKYYEIGEYLTTLIAETDKGCRDTSYQWIEITDEITLYIPNAFNPFSSVVDNKIFRPEGRSVDTDTYHMYIFNRWGEMIFDTKSFELGWNGKIKGEVAPTGYYSYKITYSDFLGNRHNETGNVLLIY